ncbi:MAG: hypothetical protein M3N11_03370 [Actinomycetota bacterium]|nr:hypothetical protein [Actinomycetota bacterium]
MWFTVLAVSAVIVVAAMVVMGAAVAAGLMVPYRSWRGRSEGERGHLRAVPSPPREARTGAQATTTARGCFGEPAWGGAPLGTEAVESNRA